MKAKEIQELIDFISKSGLEEVNIETEEFKIKVRKSQKVETKFIESAQATGGSNTTVSNSLTTPPAASEKEAPASAESDESKYLTIKSPMIGTFYRSSNPESEPFVKVGD